MQAITSSIWSNVRNFDNLAISPGSVGILWVFCVYFVKEVILIGKNSLNPKNRVSFLKLTL